MMRCCAVDETGRRCRRRVSASRRTRALCLCATHGRLGFLAFCASFTAGYLRDRLAAHGWTHVNEIPRDLRDAL
jgi:hypothetical protein